MGIDKQELKCAACRAVNGELGVEVKYKYTRSGAGEVLLCHHCYARRKVVDIDIDILRNLGLRVQKKIEEEKTAVNHPKHYNTGKYEVIAVIEDWKLGFNLGNAIKYIARCDHKNAPVEDLEKAVWYLQREIVGRGQARASARL